LFFSNFDYIAPTLIGMPTFLMAELHPAAGYNQATSFSFSALARAIS
jgi:hypothetical protein